jgi:hypothetical protein
MLKKLAYAGAFVGAVAAVTAIGCGGSGGGTNKTFDFSTPNNGDGGGGTGADAHVTDYFATNPHDVDVATIADPNGLNTVGTPISMSGLIVLASPNGFSAKVTVSGDGCRYEVWAQDPACTAPPCGIVLETQAILNPNGAGMFCPYSDELTDDKNVLQNTHAGDVISVKGVVDNFPSTGSATDGGTAATITEHEVELDSLTTTTPKGPYQTAMEVTDTNPSMFIPYTGSGWAKYEGMYIKLVPATGSTFTTTLNTSSSFTTTPATCGGTTPPPGNTNGSFTVAPGGAYFADTYAGFYIEKDAGEKTNCWPTDGLTFSSISGIVSTGFGGSILPSTETDFAK